MNRCLVLAAVVAATGCSSARYVQRGVDEGIVAVPDRSNTWPTYNNDKALTLIKEHVGPDYEIVEEWVSKSGGTGVPSGNGLKPMRDPATGTQFIFQSNDPRSAGAPATDQAEATELFIRYRRRAAGGGDWLPSAAATASATPRLHSPGPATGVRPASNPEIVPAAVRGDVPPLILPASTSTPAPTSVNPVTNIPPPVLPASGFTAGK
jgi:hypothetical protein